MEIIIITNNEMVFKKYKNVVLVDYENISYKELLLKVRNKIHMGHEILTHPLSSSVKPNESPFKSVIITKKLGKLNYNSLMIIENSILTYEKFEKIDFNWSDEVLDDFRIIDLTNIEGVMEKIIR